jgi:hypothetical protein
MLGPILKLFEWTSLLANAHLVQMLPLPQMVAAGGVAAGARGAAMPLQVLHAAGAQGDGDMSVDSGPDEGVAAAALPTTTPTASTPTMLQKDAAKGRYKRYTFLGRVHPKSKTSQKLSQKYGLNIMESNGFQANFQQGEVPSQPRYQLLIIIGLVRSYSAVPIIWKHDKDFQNSLAQDHFAGSRCNRFGNLHLIHT